MRREKRNKNYNFRHFFLKSENKAGMERERKKNVVYATNTYIFVKNAYIFIHTYIVFEEH